MTLSKDDIEALLPFYVNGTLEPSEMADVEAALEQDDELRAQVEALAAIRDTMQADSSDVRSPGEFGLARLMRDIEREEATTTPPVQAGRDRSLLWKVAAGVLLAIGVAQAVLLSQSGDSDFRLAGDGGGAEAAIVVTFVPDASEQEIRDLMLSAGVEFVAGPSALGLYEVSNLPGVDTDAALQLLLAAEGVVESAQRIVDE